LKIFLTGATGFVGSYIARLLLGEGHSIIANRRTKSRLDLLGKSSDQIDWIEASLFDTQSLYEAIENADAIIHCAGLISMDPKDSKAMYRVNHEGTKEVVDIALDVGVTKFIHLSSIAALGREKNKIEIDESAVWEENGLNSVYGRSKMLGEMEVWRGQAEGLNAVILNPSLVFGGGFWNAGSPGVIKKFSSGYNFYATGSTGVVDVRDVAMITKKALDSDLSGERYIVSAENISFEKMMKDVAVLNQAKEPQKPLDGIYKSLAWRADYLKSVLSGSKRSLTKDSVESFSRQNVFNNNKSIKAFDHNYIPWNVMVADAVASYKASLEERAQFGIVNFS